MLAREGSVIMNAFQRCTRCLKSPPGGHGIMLPIMGCMVMLCGPCSKALLMSGVIATNQKVKIVHVERG